MHTVQRGTARGGEVIGCSQLAKGTIDLAQAVLLLMLSYSFFSSIRQLMSATHDALSGIAATIKVDEILNLDASRIHKSEAETAHEIAVKYSQDTLAYLQDYSGIIVKDIVFNYHQRRQVLKQLSIEIPKGKTTAIVGKSGCGKSTLIRALIQMMNKSEEIISGEILFNERNLLSLDSKQIRKLRGNNLAVIFQNPGATLNPIRKIGKQFVQTMQSHMNINKNEALEKAANMLEKVNLKDSKCILNSYPFELSGGMKQRVTIALAMIL